MRVAARRGMRIRFDRGTLVLEGERDEGLPDGVEGAIWDEELRAWRVPADQHGALKARLAACGMAVTDEVRGCGVAVEWQLPALRWYQEAALEGWLPAGGGGGGGGAPGAGGTAVAGAG